jgi:type I restriction enzyme M protein
MPIMGLIFLRHATNRFCEAKAVFEADKAAGKMPKRPLVEADFARRRALRLPESARFDVILKTPNDGNLGAALNAAKQPIEDAFPPLAGQLPKDHARQPRLAFALIAIIRGTRTNSAGPNTSEFPRWR